MELVEIIMKVEDQFEVSLTDSEASEAVTVGKFVDVIYSRLRKSLNDPCPSQHAFYLVRRKIIEIFRVPRSKIKIDSKFEDIVPKDGRRKVWGEFLESLFGYRESGLTLELPVLHKRIVIYAIPTLVFLTISLKLPVSMFWVGIIVAFLSVMFFDWLATPMKNEFQTKYSLVRDIIPFVSTSSVQLWTKAEIFEKVKEITVEITGIKPELVTLSSNWVDDLGVE